MANRARFAIFAVVCGVLAAVFVTLGLDPQQEESMRVGENSQPSELPELATYAMVVVPTDESIVTIPPDFYVESRPASVSARPARQATRQPRRNEPQPGTITVMSEPAAGPTPVQTESDPPIVSPAPVAEVAVGGVATQVAPDSYPLSVVTDIETSAGQTAFVTEVSTDSVSNDAEPDYVTNVAPESAAEGLSGVVTTVGARRPVAAQPGVGSRMPDPDDPLPLSALEFSRYVEPEFPELRGKDSGWIDVSFSVDERGRTADVEVTDSSLPRRFNRAALNAVKKWRFEPYSRSGAAVTVDSAVRLRVE